MNPQNINELTQKAVKAATLQNWDKAITYNQEILNLDPENISALNRLGRSYLETNNANKASQAFNQVLKLDKHNPIAKNQLTCLKSLKKQKSKTLSSNFSNFSFIEEPGKTKTISLCTLAPHSILSTLVTSQLVDLKIKKKKVCIQTQDGRYIGYLPDDISRRLTQFIKLGNKYTAAIKTATTSKVEIFVRETKRSSRLKGLPSFPTGDTDKYYQFLPTEPINEVALEIPDPEE